jgi:hypothetical protein
MRVYHGGYCSNEKPEIRLSRNNKDFGPGFYCSALQVQSERWAKRFQTPVVSVFEYTERSDVEVLQFETMTEEWLDFISACRSGQLHTSEIVIGAMANDQIWNYIADYVGGVINREQFWVLAQFKRVTHQIAFCSLRSLSYLQFIGSYEVTQ